MNNKIKKRFMNRLVFLLIICFVFLSNLVIGQVGIGTTSPNASSILDLSSPNKGILIPRTDTLSIATPAKGLIICDTSTSTGLNYFYFNGVYWQSLGKNAGTFLDSFNGNRTVKRAGIPNINVGTKTNVIDFLNEYFFPFLSATISISGNVLYEIGTSNNVTISGSTNVFDETIFSNGRVDETSPSVSTIFTFGSATTYSTTYLFTPLESNVSTQNISFIARQDVNNNGSPKTINSSTKFIQSVFPYLHVVTSVNLTSGGTLAYSSSTKIIQAFGNKTVTHFSSYPAFIYFMYPQSYGPLTLILDHNNYDVTTSFTRYTVPVSSVGLANNWTTNYYIYQSNTTQPNNFNFQYKY